MYVINVYEKMKIFEKTENFWGKSGLMYLIDF